MEQITYECRECLVGNGWVFWSEDGQVFARPCEECNERGYTRWKQGRMGGKVITPSEPERVKAEQWETVI